MYLSTRFDHFHFFHDSLILFKNVNSIPLFFYFAIVNNTEKIAVDLNTNKHLNYLLFFNS